VKGNPRTMNAKLSLFALVAMLASMLPPAALTHASPASVAQAGTSEHPAWSPDGWRIAYQYRGLSSIRSEIHVLNLDSSADANLSLISSSDTDPAWSPDGARIVFRCEALPSGTHMPDLCVMNADGTGRRALGQLGPDGLGVRSRP